MVQSPLPKVEEQRQAEGDADREVRNDRRPQMPDSAPPAFDEHEGPQHQRRHDDVPGEEAADPGRKELLEELHRDVAALGEQTPDVVEGKHWFNHLLFNTDGTRFIFLHRWKPDGGRAPRWKTRMFTANADGSEPYILDSSGLTSHFIWRDPQHVCAWSGVKDPAGFYLFKDRTDVVAPVGRGVMTVDGHNTYLPIGDGTEWILCDTYPSRTDRRQTVYLYHVPTGKRTDLGRFHLPPEYTGEWRCDTHPRSSRNGKLVCIDAPHGKEGRQLHLLDLSGIVG